ncbi:hypothetical protein NUU61_007577 [Penicillium alfredii]|uniref:Major facilitator superfamily (MFS) profile domain-containing protein n=1 Tax=Penicillium alfredii TaxID=1506179 RepID=A0A9W9EQZ7_9EURO|nr:uncharacterized protein NUU61_007577 [Penicillium alfredii]KAJ5086270.1 hypothetical protein NUU61_007577 [Penicillium alfredii]
MSSSLLVDGAMVWGSTVVTQQAMEWEISVTQSATSMSYSILLQGLGGTFAVPLIEAYGRKVRCAHGLHLTLALPIGITATVDTFLHSPPYLFNTIQASSMRFAGWTFGHFFNDMASGLLTYGLTMHFGKHWIGLAFGWIMVNIGMVATIVAISASAYALERYPEQSTCVSAILNMWRTCGGFAVGYLASLDRAQRSWTRVWYPGGRGLCSYHLDHHPGIAVGAIQTDIGRGCRNSMMHEETQGLKSYTSDDWNE